MAAGIVAAASVLAPFLVPEEPSVSPERDHKRAGLLRWAAMLMLLVWLDSAAFYVIQHDAVTGAGMWNGTGRLLLNAGVHLGAALLAGVWLDCGVRVSLVVAAFIFLGGACALLGEASASVSAMLYVAGVSMYSVVLVYYPARSRRVRHAGVVYGVAGWVGSALGIGMAQDLEGVPLAFVAVAGLVIAVMVVWRIRAMRGAVVIGLLGCWGPDLATVGRRIPVAEWHREHLKAPRRFNPRSRMPSYAYLFKNGDERGEALVVFWVSLGQALR